MKKVILTLFVSLSCIMLANASWNLSVVDMLSKRIINGVERITMSTTYQSGEIFSQSQSMDFDKCFQKFESKYPGMIDCGLKSKETIESVFDWQDHIWETLVPAVIKALKGINIKDVEFHALE